MYFYGGITLKTISETKNTIVGGSPVAIMSDLSWEEYLVIYYFRCCFESSQALLEVHEEFSFYLGSEEADKTLGALKFLFSKLQSKGRRHLVRHDLNCKCVGVDENCFAQLVTRSTHADKKDAILIGILLSDADLAPELVYAAEDFAMGVKSLLKVIGSTSKDSKPMSRVLYN